MAYHKLPNYLRTCCKRAGLPNLKTAPSLATERP